MELNKEDVARLLADPSPEARAAIAGKIGLELTNDHMSEAELELARDIVRHLAKDLALQVRTSLAASVKNAKKLPRDVAVRLASDVEQVSLPVLEFSSVLTDADLVQIISSQSAEKQEAIAKREIVSATVSTALVNEGSEKVVTQLLKNRNAQILDSTLEQAIDKFPESTAVQESLVQRPRLPLSVAEKLVSRVSDALKEYLVAHHELPGGLAADVVMQSRERMTVGLLAAKYEEHDVERLAQQMMQNGRLTPSLVIRALCVGDIPFVEAAFAALANIPITNARVLIHDAGKLGLKSLYDRTGMPQGMYAIIRVALEVVKDTPLDGGENDRDRYRARVIERILTQYEDFNADDLNYLLDKLDDLVERAS